MWPETNFIVAHDGYKVIEDMCTAKWIHRGCMYICLSTCLHKHIYIDIYLYVYIYVYVCMYMYVCMCVYVYIYVYMYVYVYICIYMDTRDVKCCPKCEFLARITFHFDHKYTPL